MTVVLAILLLALPFLAFAADCKYEGGLFGIGGEIKCRKGTSPIQISGFASTSRSSANGIYDPTDEVHAGVTVYRKRGDPDQWLEYGGGGKTDWFVKHQRQEWPKQEAAQELQRQEEALR